MLNKFILKIRKRETPFYFFLYRLAKFLTTFNMPTIKIIHLPLYYLNEFLGTLIHRILEIFWYVPLFKARCEHAGKNLSLPNGIPLIMGHLKIYVGDNVSIGRSTLIGYKASETPELHLGNNVIIGYGTTISVGNKVVIGDHSQFAFYAYITDNDAHPVNPQKRLLRMPVDKENVEPIEIGRNVWVGGNVTILKGVKIGDNSVIGTHSVLGKGVYRENCVFSGFPVRCIKEDIDKE